MNDPAPLPAAPPSRVPSLALVVAALLGVLDWWIFRPGLVSYDAVVQLGSAHAGRFSDWHPPLMSALMALWFRLGGSVASLTLVQSVAATVGIVLFARACLRILTGAPRGTRSSDALALGILVVLLAPPGPLAFHLMTLWKDTWVLVTLVWTGWATAEIALRRAAGARIPVGLWAVWFASAIGGALLRHNAVVYLPFLGVVLWRLMRPRHGAAAAMAVAAPLVLAVLGDEVLDRVLHVRRMHPESQVMALELAGLCVASDAACAELDLDVPLPSPAALRPVYRAGDVGSIFWGSPPAVTPDIMGAGHVPTLQREYLRAAWHHPWLIAEVKTEAFLGVLGLSTTSYYFHDTIAENRWGLVLAPGTAAARAWLARTTAFCATGPLRWIAGVHAVWLVALLGCGIAFGRRARRDGDDALRTLAVFTLVPLAYYFSYWLATPVHDHRFMLPATVTSQVLTLAAAGAALAARRSGRRRNAAAGAERMTAEPLDVEDQ